MVQELVHDPILLARKSTPATATDAQTVQDLLDTLAFHRDTCVGMAANMIGVCKRIIAFDCDGTYMVMLNPEIVKQSDAYSTHRIVILSCYHHIGSNILKGTPDKKTIFELGFRNSRYCFAWNFRIFKCIEGTS